MSADAKKAVDPNFPRFVYSATGKRQVDSVEDFVELVQATGPVWFDSPDKVPAPVVTPAIDWEAKFYDAQAENGELRKVNSDLVAKLMSRPEPKGKTKADSE